MRSFSRVRSAAGLASIALLSCTQRVAAQTSVPSPNLDLSALGQVAVVGDFDAISLYNYVGQKEGYGGNGSQSIISSLSSGAYKDLASTDASINSMCAFVLNTGELAGVVVGGNFSSIGGVDASSIALFNPSTNSITPLPGIHGTVSAILCDQDTNSVYVGGSFQAANSTNAIAWVGMTGWANLPFAGFNAPVTSITKAPNGHFVFGGSFSGLGNETVPSVGNAQVVNLVSASITAGSSSTTPGFSNPQNIVCASNGTDSSSSTWLLADQTAGFWRAETQFGFIPSKLRLWNTNEGGRGTQTFRFIAQPDATGAGGILNFTTTDPATGKEISCDATCGLSHNSSNPYQDFFFVNPVGMNIFQIDISAWYGDGAGLDGIELFTNDIFTYAVADFNEPACSATEFPSEVTVTGGWSITPSGASVSEYLSIDVDVSQYAQTSVVFQPDIKQSGNYTVVVYTPGCEGDGTCASRGIVQVSGTLTSDGSTAFSVDIYQTNQNEKYDQIYLGEVDACSSSFRPSVTLTPTGGVGSSTVVASRIRFGLISSIGGLNGLFDYNPNLAVVDTDFSKSAIDDAGTLLHAGAQVNALVTHNETIYVGGLFSDDVFENIMAFTNNNASSLPGHGLNSAVFALYDSGDFLFVGGNFTDTSLGGVVGLNNVAAYAYATDEWVALGSGLDGAAQIIVPIQLNLTANQPETAIAFSGTFSHLLINEAGSTTASSSLSTITSVGASADGFAIWVPSQNNWLQNLNVSKQDLTGQLSAAATVPNGPQLLAGTLASEGLSISGVASLQQSSSVTTLQGLPINIHSSSSPTGLTKRALTSQQNVTGIAAAAYYYNGGRNVTVFGGSFQATASDGPEINNLLFWNATDNNNVHGLSSGIDSNSTFLALAIQADLLFAGGSVSGEISHNNVNGLIVYDLHLSAFRTPQPAALAGENVVVNAITTRPSSSQVYVGGSFEQTSQELQCTSVCMYDTSTDQWNSVGNALTGTVSALFWASNSILVAAGNLTVESQSNSTGTPTALAQYSINDQVWSVMSNTDLPGEATAFAPATADASRVWVAGTATNGSVFLVQVEGSEHTPVGDVFGPGTTIRGLQVMELTQNHASSPYLNDDQTLLCTGNINLPEYGNASAVLFDGTSFVPFILASTSSGSSGSIAQLVSSKTNTLESTIHHHSRGITVLVSLCAALGTIFVIVLLGLLLERIQRRRAGYHPVSSVPYADKNSNISRVPPERLFGTLGKNGNGNGTPNV